MSESARTLSAEEIDAIAEAVALRLDARLRKTRAPSKRRTKNPVAAAKLATEAAKSGIDDVARARAARALERLRSGSRP
jgi:hypothetical protein